MGNVQDNVCGIVLGKLWVATLKMVGNWAGQRRGIRLSAEMPGFNTGFPFHFLFHTDPDGTNKQYLSFWDDLGWI